MKQGKIYRLFGIDMAVQLLRPGAIWEISNGVFTKWDDPRPCPTFQEVLETMQKVKEFENSINTIWLPEQIEDALKQQNLIDNEIAKQAIEDSKKSESV